ncbi:MAG TPA: hypothetical protein VIK71_05485 [Flavobacteriales bacterium]|jgi:hypothetical protein
MRNRIILLATLALMVSIAGCKKEEKSQDEQPTNPAENAPKLIFKFVFDSTQVRLNNLGQPSEIPAGHGAQSPHFRKISQHYIELANDWNLLGAGEVLFQGHETTQGGATAIDHNASVKTGNGEVFYSVPLSSIEPGSYKWLRVSLAYQEYDIELKYETPWVSGVTTGTVGSFIGYRTYIDQYTLNGQTYVPSEATGGVGNHPQGYWGFQTTILGQTLFFDGQAPEGATTVPNPLFATSPIPQGSCVVTGQFVDVNHVNSPLVITGNETDDIVITVSLSTNKSFEWIEVNEDGYFQPDAGESVVDMGIRGMIPIVN